jgi:hypothetical protein
LNIAEKKELFDTEKIKLIAKNHFDAKILSLEYLNSIFKIL